MDLVMVPDGRYAAATGRRCARWLLSCAAAAMMCAGGAPAAASNAAPIVTVTEIDGAYNVHTVFEVAQSPGAAIAVLTDYARIPEFLPDVKTSKVLERTAEGAVVEQSAVSKFMLFSKRVHLVLEIREEGGTIRFRDRCGKSFTIYDGAWVVTARDGRAVITYHLMAKPAFDVPGFVLTRLLKRDAADLIGRISSEIRAREAR